MVGLEKQKQKQKNKKTKNKKTITYATISPKTVNPRDIAGERRRRKKNDYGILVTETLNTP